MTRHVASSGARAGQWVNCTAKNSCRLGGSHISEREFYGAKAWLQENRDPKDMVNITNTKITKEDVEKFQAATVGQEAKWGRKAEKLARKDKGLKDYNVPVFEGEENVVKSPARPKKFVPNVPANRTPKATPSPVAAPKPQRYIDIPDVRRFLLTGDTTAMARARDQYNIPRATLVGIASVRVRMTHNDPLGSSYVNEKTGEVYKGSEIPEVREYLRTGDEAQLQEAEKKYGIGEGTVENLKEGYSRKLKADAKAAKKNKTAKATKQDQPLTALNTAFNKVKEVSSRLTNISDDISKVSSPEDEKSTSGQGGKQSILKRLFS